MQVYQQHLLVETLGPFVAIVGLFSSHNGPSQGHQQHFLLGTLGPFVANGSISRQQ